MANYDLTNLALKATNPGNVVLLDDKNLPSIMVRIPKFTIGDVVTGGGSGTHPAFIVNGEEVPEIYISKYQNVVYNGRAYSLPGEDPAHSMNFDAARGYCEAKGPGWHLMTNAEWAALALWCRKNNLMPKGNNDYGKDSTESACIAIPAAYDTSTPPKITRVLTGTGPKTWAHNGELNGIYDLNGNVSEWIGGVRTVMGEIQVLDNNNAADPDNPQNATSVEWKAIDATTGEMITPDGSGTTANSVKLDRVSNQWQLCTSIVTQVDQYFGSSFAAMTCHVSVTETARLVALALFPADSGDYGGDNVYFNNGAAERLVRRGGGWYSGASGGVFYASGGNGRSDVSTSCGFRSAYIPGI